MTEWLPDGSIKLSWERKSETVAPDDLNDWQPIEAIPDIDLPNIETVEIPPVVVLDIETKGLDPKHGRISACGLALFVAGKEVETQIIRNEGDEDNEDNEADLIAQVFHWLRETCDRLGEVILTGYNLLDFDLPYLIERAHKLKVGCPFRYLKGDNGEPKRWRVAATEGTLKGDPLDYPAIVVDRDLPIVLIDTLHLVCRWDYTAKALRNYDLKSVAAHFGVNQPDRPILTPEQIMHAFKHDPEIFNAYLLADLRETYALFAKLIPPYAGVAALTKLPLDQVATRSTAWVWEQILERYYTQIPQPDEKRKYEGGLVVSRKGLWFPCLKVDIASLYPTIMLAYRIHSRKDTAQIALRWLKTLTEQRLALKAKAKAGDTKAQILQEAMKILLNSLYGFYGTGGYGFNDMGAAAKVTEVGRKVLTLMIEAVEDAGGLVVEADTDGLIICHANADPQQILNAITAAIPPVFKVEVEWQEAVCFVSDDKSYIVLPKEGDPIIKGSKWRGRDKEAYLTKAIPTFVRLWALEGKDAALAFALQTLNEIRAGQGWRWVIRSHRVSKADKFLLQVGFKVGEIATYAYKDKKRGIVAREPEDGYDCDYYAKQFSKTLKEVVEVIDPAQIEAWERIVKQEACLI
jgi:DNA polymerase elongation subunit (family B)